ncbi:NADH-quinone oxidoreductase subunit C [Acidianus sulfidivorans JP7]|uniref:NADH-quinone oxidoreductase subunit C n=1 Tax=Acidianus sulfidivorans JP7 TaxID=619593 RepID=A0A2U9IQJ2_9CREN|nr:NADH-quinone oxidoreductase subunit C [Acidianus sulfidivorans]AWR98309.1 NADH-quinone oxidoreductase subunit C [Acidianus sulfidivorans JP7]
MSQRLIDQIVSELQKNKFSAKAESEYRGYVEINKDQIVNLANLLKNMGFDHVKSITGIDFPDQHKIQIVYHVSSYSNLDLAKIILAIKTYVPYEDPRIQSLTEIWDSAWTGERETYEMLGVIFVGHPDLRRLFLPEDFEGVYPLRKDFKIKLEGLFVDKS